MYVGTQAIQIPVPRGVTADVLNDGNKTVYWGMDSSVSAAKNLGSIVAGAKATFDRAYYIVCPTGSTDIDVIPQAVSVAIGGVGLSRVGPNGEWGIALGTLGLGEALYTDAAGNLKFRGSAGTVTQLGAP